MFRVNIRLGVVQFEVVGRTRHARPPDSGDFEYRSSVNLFLKLRYELEGAMQHAYELRQTNYTTLTRRVKNRVNLKMRTRKKVYASEVKTPPSKAKEVPFLFRDDEGDDLEKDAIVEETEVEAAPATSNGGEDVGDGHSDDDDDDEAPEDVGFSEAKSLALESMAVQKKTKVEVASRRKEKRRLQLERNIQQKEKKLKKITKTGKGEHGGEEGDELSLDFLEKLDEASKIARDAFFYCFYVACTL